MKSHCLRVKPMHDGYLKVVDRQEQPEPQSPELFYYYVVNISVKQYIHFKKAVSKLCSNFCFVALLNISQEQQDYCTAVPRQNDPTDIAPVPCASSN